MTVNLFHLQISLPGRLDAGGHVQTCVHVRDMHLGTALALWLGHAIDSYCIQCEG